MGNKHLLTQIMGLKYSLTRIMGINCASIVVTSTSRVNKNLLQPCTREISYSEERMKVIIQ